MNLIFLGNNDPRIFKRGVENVIYAQSNAFDFGTKYYIFFGKSYEIFKWEDIICISIKKDWKYFIILNLIIKKIKKRSNSKIIIHSHGPVRTLLSIYKTDILTVHDAIYYQRKGLGQRFNWIFYLVEKLAYLRSSQIHFISQYSKKQSLISKKQNQRSFIVYNTTPIEKLITDKAPLQNVDYSISEQYFTILAVRGIEERTRIDVLIKFAKDIDSITINGKKIRILVAGKGKLLNYYRNEISNNNISNINLLGYVSDDQLASLYLQSDCVILTCDHAEGFGLPIIEGYCADKPVIASNHCAVPEIIINPQFLFENNSESILKVLFSVTDANYDYSKYYESKFSNSIYKEKFNTIYKNFLNKK